MQGCCGLWADVDKVSLRAVRGKSYVASQSELPGCRARKSKTMWNNNRNINHDPYVASGAAAPHCSSNASPYLESQNYRLLQGSEQERTCSSDSEGMEAQTHGTAYREARSHLGSFAACIFCTSCAPATPPWPGRVTLKEARELWVRTELRCQGMRPIRKQSHASLLVVIGSCVTSSWGRPTQTGRDPGRAPEEKASTVDQGTKSVS